MDLPSINAGVRPSDRKSRMGTLEERIALLISQQEILEQWVGSYDDNSLKRWLDAEMGDWRRLEAWVEGSRVVARGPVLHVVSGNTEHAAFQSVFRAILVGAESWVKVPSEGLVQFERWAAEIDSVEVMRKLPEEWRSPDLAVIYGGSATLDFFRVWLAPGTRIIEHGPKLSAAFVFAEREKIFEDLAEDILRYGQRGCLSVRMIYVSKDVEGFCERLANAMMNERRLQGMATLSEAGGVRNERELARFRMANGAKVKIWESESSVDWTVLMEDGKLRPGPGCGFVQVSAMPEALSRHTLGDEIDFVSTAVVEPISEAFKLDEIAPPRICAAGMAQEPGIFWHPDGEMPLAGLVRWRDLR